MGVNVGKPNVLIKLDEENGKLTYGGVPVCEGQHGGGIPVPVTASTVALVDSFADLDPQAEDGSLALAWNPDYQMSPLELGAYDTDKERYSIPNKLVSFASGIEYREAMYTRALQNFLAKYPMRYASFWPGATFDTYRAERGVFRQNGDGTYTDITDTLNIGDDISAYYYGDRDHSFYLDAELCSTHKDFSVWDREYMVMSAVPVITDEQDNIFVRERIEREGILDEGVIAPNATTKYLVAAMWSGDPMHRTFLELFPGATKVGGNVYRVPIVFLYSFEDMDASFEFEQDDDSDKGYHKEMVSFHLQAGWNVVYVIGAMRFDAKEKEWELENADFDSVEPMDSAPAFSVQTDETGTIEYWRENADLVLEGALLQKKEIHPSGFFIKTENWQPVHAGMLPRIDVDKYSSLLDELYERVDETINDLEDNPPYHHNRQVLDRLNEDGGALTYNGQRMRILQSVQFNCSYDNYDEYILYFADGSTDTMIIQHTPSDNAISKIDFYRTGDPCITSCSVQYEDGSAKDVPLSGLDLSVAFTNFREPTLHQTREFGDTRMYLKLGGSNPTEGGYSQYVDLSESDRDTAKLDYIDMMLGIGFETQLLFERVQRNYNAGFWTQEHLRQAVAHGWINEIDYENLTGYVYEPDEEEDNTNDQG